MNKRHDALYSRARVVLNQNIKRLWFKVNPYLEKKDTLHDEPESPTKFIQPLQSTILSEGFLKDESTDHRALSIGAFWEFLYSDKWPGGASVRVMEGQLLDNLLTTLHILVKEGEVVKHKTFAYARNQRERRGCYKLANQKGCDSIQETLLLEFTYFARRIVPSGSVQSDFSAYPESITTTASSNYDSHSRQEMSEQVVLNDALSKRGKKFNKRRPAAATNFGQPTSRPVSRSTFVRSRPRSNVGTLEEEGYSPIMNDLSPTATFPNNSELQKIEIVPITHTYSSQISNTSSESDYRGYGPLTNLNKFHCTEKILYEDGIIDIDPPTTEDLSFLDGFYLSENIGENFPEHQTVLSKLQERKQEKIKEKEEIKNLLQDWYSRRLSSSFSSVPTEFSDPLDGQMQYRFLEFVPTFEEFLLMLDEDQKYDPRFKRQKQISRKIAQRYNIAKDRIQGVVAETEVKPRKKSSTACKLQPITEKTRRFSTPSQAFREQSKELKPKLDVIKSSSVLETHKVQEESADIQRIAKEVGGVTVSQPCEKHVMEHGGKRRSSRRESRRFSTNKSISSSEKKKKTLCTPSIYLTSPTGAHFVLYQAPPTSLSSMHSKDDVKKTRSSSIKMQSSSERRTSLSQRMSVDKRESSRETECPDTSSDSDDGISGTPELFDARKLNTKYSFERLRGKNYHKKKPAFYSVLRKYYRAQKAVDAFQASNDAARKRPRKSVFHRLLHPNEPEEMDEGETIGKMKQYNFLLHRRRTRVKIDPQTFESYSLADFKDNVLRALDDFVVRKEYVISDIGAKSSTTITFTRKYVFSEREY